MQKIRKAVIPAAGLGTRFLPATKAMAKEMMPIVDTPSIQYVVEEAIASGIEEIIIVSGKGKSSIEDHFDVNFTLEENLRKNGKNEMLTILQKTNIPSIHYVRQPYPKGLGDAILQAAPASRPPRSRCRCIPRRARSRSTASSRSSTTK